MSNIELFRRKYRAISNVFVSDIESNNYTYPYPIEICATISTGSDDSTNNANDITFRYESFYDSMFTLDGPLNVDFYVLALDYSIEHFLFGQIILKEVNTDAHGYKGTYSYQDSLLVTNICSENEKVYKVYKDYYEEATL